MGTGGLVRAYTQAVKEGLEHCVIGVNRRGSRLEVITDYNGVGKILYLLGQRGLEPAESNYGERVTLWLIVPVEEEESLCREITEATMGRAAIEKLGELYYIS